ncbi:MAG: peptidoglycan-binding protein [Pseudomonadota bacterium]
MKDVSDMASRFADDSAHEDDKDTDATASSAKAAKSRRKPAPKRKSTPTKRATVASVKAELNALESRLKKAEGVTQRSIGSLESVVSALEANLKNSSATQKGRLTKHVNELTERLDRQTAQMRAAVRSELRTALSEGGVDNVDAALGRASARLDRAEVAQADAIARLNKHLADMARAVDARMKSESEARKAELDQLADKLTTAIATSQTDLIERVETIERDSSAAFNTVGETIERLHSKLESRRKTSNETVIEKINALAVQTKADIESRQFDLNARFEEIEARTLAVGKGAAERAVEKARADLDHKIDSLKSRLSDLEGKTADALKNKIPQVTPASATPKADSQSGPDIALAPLPPLPKIPNNGSAPSAQPVRQRGGQASAAMASPNAADNPYAASLKAPEDAQKTQPLMPPAPVLPFPSQTPAQTPGQPQGTNTGGAPSLPPFQMPTAQTPPPGPAAAQAEPFQPAPVPGAVYSDPAYAEESDSPMALRFIDDGPKKGLAVPEFLKGGAVRIALLATGVAVVALMAGRMILGGSNITNPNVTGANEGQAVVMTEPDTGTMPLTGVGPDTTPSGSIFGSDPYAVAGETSPSVTLDPTVTTDPIGNYTERQPVVLDNSQLDTLDAAVEAGNPIAQYQKGLAELDAGRTDAGASLIRQAANGNQPAALYSLAKLYEAGQGVPRDDVMARQLIERAARGGNRIAMHDLALYYTEGRGGVELDMLSAKSWFEQAARRGVVDSQFNLAILSESTETGTEPNLEEALFWYSVAAQQGDQFAVSRRDALKATMSADRADAVEDRVNVFKPEGIDEEANGIFRNVPWVQSSDTASRTQVREVQTLLATLGYPVGTPDGIMGTRTRNAIVAFERANGLSETGEVNGNLISRLSRAAGA